MPWISRACLRKARRPSRGKHGADRPRGVAEHPGEDHRVALVGEHPEDQRALAAVAAAASLLAEGVPLGLGERAGGDRQQPLLLGVEVLGEGDVEGVVLARRAARRGRRRRSRASGGAAPRWSRACPRPRRAAPPSGGRSAPAPRAPARAAPARAARPRSCGGGAGSGPGSRGGRRRRRRGRCRRGGPGAARRPRAGTRGAGRCGSAPSRRCRRGCWNRWARWWASCVGSR